MKTNHQREFKEKVTRYVGKSRNGDNGLPGHKDFGEVSLLADVHVGARASTHDTTNGKHGVARNIKGAKKFVNSRIRFHENAVVKKMLKEDERD